MTERSVSIKVVDATTPPGYTLKVHPHDLKLDDVEGALTIRFIIETPNWQFNTTSGLVFDGNEHQEFSPPHYAGSQAWVENKNNDRKRHQYHITVEHPTQGSVTVDPVIQNRGWP